MEIKGECTSTVPVVRQLRTTAVGGGPPTSDSLATCVVPTSQALLPRSLRSHAACIACKTQLASTRHRTRPGRYAQRGRVGSHKDALKVALTSTVPRSMQNPETRRFHKDYASASMNGPRPIEDVYALCAWLAPIPPDLASGSNNVNPGAATTTAQSTSKIGRSAGVDV